MPFVSGLKVEGLYRRCGIAPQISKLVDALRVSPRGTVLGTDEFSILDVSGALKQILRQEIELIPNTQKPHWLKAAGTSVLRGHYPDTQLSHRTSRSISLAWSEMSLMLNVMWCCYRRVQTNKAIYFVH